MGRHGAPSRRRHARGDRRRAKRRGKLKVIAWVTAALVVLGTAGAAALVHRLQSNVRSVDIDSALGGDRPPASENGAMNILILGSDSRTGDGTPGSDRRDGSARSDTAMVLHVYQGRREAALVSIPRDTLVTRPACTTPAGTRIPGGTRLMFNEAYAVGGPACAVSTVERMSGLRMDHYVELDFTGFKKIIDTLGGVTLTLNEPIRDKASGLDLKAGTHTLNGTQSLGLVRTRKSVGDGSDLGRIQLQQAFVKALLAQVSGSRLLQSPTRLLTLADTATKSMTTDSGLAGASALVNLASTLKNLGSSGLKALTLPVGPDARDPNRVVPLASESRQVWEALRADRPVPQSATTSSMGDKGTAGSVVTP
ncbi:LCP family protein [Streptomyces sp. NPDC059104]|uniref:LCP family protein n=1 Tax=Streptomyces sp. NPDC059104 TaxID=3346729 RepID=UPI0036C43F6A